MSNFTAGEWECSRNCEKNYTIHAQEDGKPKRAIAEVFTDDYGERLSEAAANARLISFAPDMFKYLVQVLNEYDLEPDLEGDIMWLIRDINGEQW